MKKIVSALAVGALVLGSAAAKTSVNLNYRNGPLLYQYTDNGEDDEKNVTKSTFGSLNDYNGGQDTLSLKASGDVLDFQLDIQPSVKDTSKDSKGAASDQLRFNVLKLGAKWGNFHIQSGWNGDGINGGYRVTNDASNHEGQLFETYKLGSLFKKSFSKYADNQINIGGNIFTDRQMYAQADYTIPVDDLKINIKGTVISDRDWTDYTEDNTGDKGWSVFVDASKAKMFKVEGFLKGASVFAQKKGETAGDDAMVLVPGLYFQWLGTDGLIATVGGAASIYDGDVSDYSADLRVRYAVNKQLSFTYYLKYSALDTDKFISAAASGKSKYAANAEIDKGIGYPKTAFTTDAVLWNFINARYVMNPTVTVSCSLAALTDLGDGAKADNKETKNGTTLSIHPNAEFTAGKGASITVGLNATFGGLGAEKDSKFGENTDLSFAVPVLFRVKM